MDLLNEYIALCHGAKIELLNKIIAWGLPNDEQNSRYTQAHQVLYQMYPDRDIFLIEGDRPQDEQQENWIKGAIDLPI